MNTTITKLDVPQPGTALEAASGAPRPLQVRRLHAVLPATQHTGAEPHPAAGAEPGSAGNPHSGRPAPVLPFPSRRDLRTRVRSDPRAEPAPPPVVSAPAAGTVSLEEARTREHIGTIARMVAQGSLEVLAGTRAAQQMARWLDPQSYDKLQLRAGLVRRLGQESADPSRLPGTLRLHRSVTVRSARICRLSPAVFECSVVVAEQQRVRAVALRIQHRRGAWRVTALEIG